MSDEIDLCKYPLMLVGRASPRDWPDDFAHENGCYECKCLNCDKFFMGYKRRMICKECHVEPPRCPKCGCHLLSNGTRLWCSFVGGGREKACDYGITEPVTIEDFDARKKASDGFWTTMESLARAGE